MSRKHYRLSNGIVGRVTVISLGHISEEMSKQMSWWHFERTGKHYRYQPGFHSKRPVTFPDGTKSGIDCRVVKIDSVIAPRFKCTAIHPRSGMTLEVIEASASAAANKILDLLDVNTNKRWSGPEFFGFTKPDVARELMRDSEHFLPEHFNKRKKYMDEKLNNHANLKFSFNKFHSPKDVLYASQLYAPTMVSTICTNDTLMKLEGISSTANSSHNSPETFSDGTSADGTPTSALNGVLGIKLEAHQNGSSQLVLTQNSPDSAHTPSSSSPIDCETRAEQEGFSSSQACVSWVELQDIGKPYHSQDYWWFLRHMNRKYRIHPGYKALKCVRSTAGEEIYLTCEVLVKDGRPLYRCSTKACAREESSSTKVVQEILKDLDVPSKKNWSGPEFFGFTRSSVIQQLLVPEGEKSPTEEKKSFASPMTPTYIPSPSNQSPNTPNTENILEPISHYLDAQGYRNMYGGTPSIKSVFSNNAKIPQSVASQFNPLSLQPLNGQFMLPGTSLLSPEMLSPRMIQNLPNFMQPTNRNSSFSRYVSLNMTECVRQLKMFITTLYMFQGEDRLNYMQLQKLHTDMERLMLLLKNETNELNQKLTTVTSEQKHLLSTNAGFIKLECDGDGRLVDSSMETDPSSVINLELEKLREVEVQCNSCQNSVTFCSGCGGRLALVVPGGGTHSETASSPSPDTVSTSAEATTTGNPESTSPSREGIAWAATSNSSTPSNPDKVEHIMKKIKLNKSVVP